MHAGYWHWQEFQSQYKNKRIIYVVQNNVEHHDHHWYEWRKKKSKNIFERFFINFKSNCLIQIEFSVCFQWRIKSNRLAISLNMHEYMAACDAAIYWTLNRTIINNNAIYIYMLSTPSIVYIIYKYCTLNTKRLSTNRDTSHMPLAARQCYGVMHTFTTTYACAYGCVPKHIHTHMCLCVVLVYCVSHTVSHRLASVNQPQLSTTTIFIIFFSRIFIYPSFVTQLGLCSVQQQQQQPLQILSSLCVCVFCVCSNKWENTSQYSFSTVPKDRHHEH